MKKEKKMKEVSVALNIGTGSVGYAVINSPIAGAYDIVKYKGNDAWGSILYDEGELCADRRGYRSSRRNLNRKKWRVDLLQEIFADEISKIDKRFFIRLEESCRWRDEVSDKNICFDEENYTDKNYYQEYPTIHHLIYDLMRKKRPHDIRIVYLACSWLLTHRGHFNSPLDINRLEEITGINQAYNEFMAYFVENGYDKPWNEVDSSTFGQVFRKKLGVKDKFTELKNLLLDGKKPSQACTESFPYSQEGILKLLSGGKYEIKKLFGKEEYDEIKSVSLGMDDESNDKIAEMIGDDMDLITILNKLYDWYLLVDILEDTSGNTCSCISEAKISIYEQHKDDLKTLKYIIKKYTPEKYNEIFREIHADNYIAYSHHIDKNMSQEKYKYTNIELFSDYISKTISKIQPDQSDMERFCDMNKRLALHTFMPKQKTKDNDYPIEPGIRKKMLPMWEQWKSIGIINDEKYNRLTRNEPFSIDERKEFTSRQLTLTSQLTKITSEVLKNRYRNMDIKIIPVSYRLLSDFRKEFDLPKSRTYNDLHNATDAYLEAVVGDVYYNKFFKKPFDFKSKYSIKLKAIFQNQQKEDDEIIWNGKSDLIKVQKIAQKTSAHIVKYSSFSTGKLFDVQLVSRKPGLVEFKKGMPTERYGGYNKPKIMFFIPVKYSIKKVENIIILPVELLYGKQFLEDKNFAIEYSHRRLEKILGKTIDNFSFPLGMRPLKMNTMLSLDGFRVCITGSSSRGKCLIVQPMMQFVSDPSWIQYLKYLENFVRKLQKDPKRKYCEKYDKITKEKNSMLYDLYIEKNAVFYLYKTTKY